jgi:hypothetical protein
MKLIIGERYYYDGLYKYFNDMYKESNANLLFLWNDDAIMKTKNWDKNLKETYEKENFKYVIYKFKVNYNNPMPFPISSKNISELLGHYSPCANCDSYLLYVGNGAKIIKNVNMEAYHIRADKKWPGYEKLYIENDKVVKKCSKIFHSEGNKKIINESIKKIKNAQKK